tara:strand:- start:13 stop:678 length:666 start_codon:yes stop_codon:yes gene_type:complete
MAFINDFFGNLQKAGFAKISLILVAVGFQFYYMYLTSPIPNFNEATGGVYYGAKDLVVPKGVTLTHVLLSSGFIISIWFVSRESSAFQIITHDLARQIVLTDLDKLKKIDPRFQGAKTFTFDFTLRRTFNESTPVPNRYIFFSRIEPPLSAGGDPPFWYRTEVNPYTGYVERRFEVKGNLTPQMLCSVCGQGNTADYKIITSEKLTELVEVKKAMGESGMK